MLQLLAEGEIWPGMAAEEFAARRKRLADALPPGGVAVVPAASRTFMTGAIPYAYRQAGPPSGMQQEQGREPRDPPGPAQGLMLP